jgi:hypothetical protein
LEFGLDCEDFDTLEKIVPESDGFKFEEIDSDPVAEAAIELLQALTPLITKARFQPFLKLDTPSLQMLSKAADMAQTLREQGYSR